MSREVESTQEFAAGTSHIADPDMPITVRLGEAESLAQVFEADLSRFATISITSESLDLLKTKTDALRIAEIDWANHRFQKDEAREEWNRLSPLAYELRDEIVHCFRYGYRKNRTLQLQIDEIEEGSSHDDMLLDLGKLGKIGVENPEELAKINFPTAKIELAMKYSDELATLYAEATIGNLGSHPKKIARDVAYADLKAIMSEIRDAGKYLFWKDAERKALYSSSYISRQSKAARERKKLKAQMN